MIYSKIEASIPSTLAHGYKSYLYRKYVYSNTISHDKLWSKIFIMCWKYYKEKLNLIVPNINKVNICISIKINPNGAYNCLKYPFVDEYQSDSKLQMCSI